MFSHLSTILLLLLVVSPVELRRASSGGASRGGSASRGQVASGSSGSRGNFNSGGRPNSGGFQPNQGGGFQQPHGSGGFQQPRPAPAGNFNHNQQQSFNNRQPTFNNGGGLGSRSSSNTFAKALAGGAAGAIGGLLVYEAGKAIIRSATTPYNHNGRNYYWDNNYQGDASKIQCSMPLSTLQQQVAAVEASTTTTTTTVAPAVGDAGVVTAAPSVETTTPTLSNTINNLQFSDGTRPKQIVWGCNRGSEVCCGSDCCPAPVNQPGNANMNNGSPAGSQHSGGGSSFAAVLAVVLLFILLAGCCCCFIAYKMCRSAFDCILPREDNKYDDGYQQGDQQYNHQQQQQQGYPMQQYPDQGGYSSHQGYPPQQQQGGYPPTHGYPQHAYPSQPTY